MQDVTPGSYGPGASDRGKSMIAAETYRREQSRAASAVATDRYNSTVHYDYVLRALMPGLAILAFAAATLFVLV